MFHDLTRENAGKVRDLMRMLRPHRLVSASKTRVGRFFDGGYVMLDRFDDVSAAYSLGINDDVSWDLDVAARGIPIYQYDHTIERLPAEHEMFHWEKIGIAAKADGEFETLERLVVKNGHETAENLLLKIDIEGFEWEVFANTPSRVFNQFSQVVAELHWLERIGEYDFGERARRGISNLMSTHKLVHVHANNHAPWIVLGGVCLPCVIEITLARKDLGTFEVSDEIFPTPLDMPCHSQLADLYLGRFTFD